MTKHLPLLLFIGLALNINNDLFAQNKSKFNKPKMTGKEKAEAKIEKDKCSTSKSALERRCHETAGYPCRVLQSEE